MPSAEKDRYLALASIANLKPFLPNVDTDKNFDLLPIALNITVVNRINKNSDVIDTKGAIACYKNFINKGIDIEHKRTQMVGTILTAGFSEFGTDKPLTEEEVSKLTTPFNIALGGVVWRSCSGDLDEQLEASADPESDTYLTISGSWEVGFTNFNLVLIKGNSKNIVDGRVIDDPKEVEKLAPNLLALGGTGKVGDEYCYRMPTDPLPMGVGLTLNPAADLEGVLTGAEEETSTTAPEVENLEISTKTKENSSHSIEATVNQISIDMKINSVEELTDDLLKQIKASTVSDFIQSEIKKASDKFTENKTAGEKALKESQELQAKTQKDLDEAKLTLKTVQDEVSKLNTQNAEREAVAAFNLRMASFDETYELTAEDRTVIGDQIKTLTKDAFESYQKSLATLMKSKNKELLKKDKETKDAEAKKLQKAAASSNETQTTVDSALQNATPDGQKIPNTAAAQTDAKAKYAKAFSLENITISKR